jgi:hypothetical protein
MSAPEMAHALGNPGENALENHLPAAKSSKSTRPGGISTSRSR